MRLTSFICAALLFLAGHFEPASALGLDVEKLDNPKAIECPYCHRTIIAGPIHESAVQTITTEFGGNLAERDISYTPGKEESRRFHVFVYRFQERQGGNFSVVRPASVGFHTHLYEGKVLVGVFVFDETQQPLSDNLLRLPTFLRRGAKWITAGELAREGVHKAIESFGEGLGEGGQTK